MGTSPPGDTYNMTGEGVPLINGPVEFSSGSFGKTVRTKFTTAPNKLCKESDLVLCVRGSTTGKMNIAGFDACIGRGVAAIRAKEYQPWINFFIRSKRDDIYSLGTGATFPNISTANLADLKILVPPLPEQRRIVGILDAAFAGIATAKANAERNLRNARGLFESHLERVFRRRGEGWVARRFGDIFDIGSSKRILETEWTSAGVPFYGGKEIVKLAKSGTVVSNAYITGKISGLRVEVRDATTRRYSDYRTRDDRRGIRRKRRR
jgi:restriction endonuclease S subunit